MQNYPAREVEKSGNISIDALLFGSAHVPVSLTFSFPDDPLLYGPILEPPPTTHIARYAYMFDFQPATYAQVFCFAYALDLVESYVNLTFTPLLETDTEHADLRFANTSAVPYGVGFPPDDPLSGDMWLNGNYDFLLNSAPGNLGVKAIIHELGHALGLSHSHDGGGIGGTLPPEQDHWSYTLMSYRRYEGDTIFHPRPFWSDNATTFMQNDIAALQHMYGANFNHNAGDTTYQWDPETGAVATNGDFGYPNMGGKIFMTLWDGDGNDTYDLSNFTSDLKIDLRPGKFSTFDDAKLADLDPTNPGAQPAKGNVANAQLYKQDPRSLIENAIGGPGSDSFIGNAADNCFIGGDGHDKMEGLGGDDTLIGGEGDDRLEGGKGNDHLMGENGYDTAVFSGRMSEYKITALVKGVEIRDLFSNRDGTDILTDILYARFSDGTLLLNALRQFTATDRDASAEKLIRTADDFFVV